MTSLHEATPTVEIEDRDFGHPVRHRGPIRRVLATLAEMSERADTLAACNALEREADRRPRPHRRHA